MNIKNQNTWPLVANENIGRFLSKSIKANNVSGSYIFSGPDNLGKTTTAKYFAQLLLCGDTTHAGDMSYACGKCASCKKFISTEIDLDEADTQAELGELHGDFFVLKKETDKKNISIEQIRDFIRMLSLSSFRGSFKVGIIKHADALSINAANALLKTLEEPNKKTVVILICKDSESLPATICSRSQILDFKPVKAGIVYDFLVNDHNISREKARDISRLCLGRPALALKFIQDKDFYAYYNTQVEAILKMQSEDINGRFAIIDSLIDKKLKGQEAVKQTQRTIEIWQGVIRDYIFVLLGHTSRVQHIYLQDSIKKNRYTHSLSELVELSKSLASAHRYLEANVSPRLSLEKIALSI